MDMIVQNVSADGATDISFTLPKADVARAEEILEPLAEEIGAKGLSHDPDVAKISLVGAGMRSHPGVAADMFAALAEAGVNIGIISTSAIRISCVVPAADVERAVQAVHERFKLHEPVVTAETGLALTRSGAPYSRSASGTSPWKFSRIASSARSVTIVPFSVCTGCGPPSPR